MEYIDLHLFPENHPPSPYNHPVMVMKANSFGDGYLLKGLSLYAVGWLEKQGFITGQVSEDCIRALLNAHTNHIIWDGTRGIHTCTLCGKSTPSIKWQGKTIELMGYGHYLVQVNNAVFMAPELVLHYILEHQYCPPQEFIQAAIHGKFLDTSGSFCMRNAIFQA